MVTHYMLYGQKPMTLEQVEQWVMAQLRAPENTVFIVCNR